MADGHYLSLEVQRLEVENLWRAALDQYLPMSVAAATAFHRVYGTSRAIVTREDYDDALNIAASALSRFLTVYSAGERGEKVPLAVDLVKQRFARGATELRAGPGEGNPNLWVRRADLIAAIATIRNAGLIFGFAASPAVAPAAPAAEPAERADKTPDERKQ